MLPSGLAFRKHICHPTPLTQSNGRVDLLILGDAMSKVAPKSRKHLSADALFRLVRNGCADIPDHRDESTDIPLSDALTSAFAMFSLKWPSLLAYDEKRTEDNLRSLYGLERAPSDSAMREIIDPVSPESMRPLFKSVFRKLQRGKALKS